MKINVLVIMFLCLMMIHLLSFQSSAIMEGLSTEELTRASNVVMQGEVEDVEVQWSKDGSTIVTRALIVITDVLRGSVAQRRIIVEYEGGEIGDIGLKVSDMVPLNRGEKIILFLKSGKSRIDGNVYNIVGKSQGKYTIGDDGIATKSGFSIAAGEEVIDNNIPVDELIDKIRRVK